MSRKYVPATILAATRAHCIGLTETGCKNNYE